MILYHGSVKIIEHPSPDFSNKSNDYGSGFYCTEVCELAKEWACRKNRDGFANRYELDMDGLTVLDLGSREYHILNWLALLTRYRGYWQRHSIAEEAKEYLQRVYLPDIDTADVIIGYRADDSYFSFAQDFVMGTISLRQLADAMRIGKLGQQIVLKGRRAFEQISFLDAEAADADTYYPMKEMRDLKARRAYNERKNSAVQDDVYMIDILRGRVSEDDLRV